MSEILETLLGMFKDSKVTYDAVKTCKVGKDVGNAMKMGDPDIAGLGRKAVGEIQARFGCEVPAFTSCTSSKASSWA